MKGELMIRKAALACVLAVAAAAGAHGAENKASRVAEDAAQPVLLPGGASALTETHGDWTVSCQVVRNTPICSLSQQQFDKAKNNQRLLAIELAAKTADAASGTLAMPFGLALAKGVSLQVDDRKAGESLQFSTCLVVGCLVPLALDAGKLEEFKAGTTLKINAVASDTGQPVNFSVSLNGFASALARTAELSAR